MKNNSILPLGLALASFAFSMAQAVFQFEQQGRNTVVTGSGSGMSGTGGFPVVGYHSGNQALCFSTRCLVELSRLCLMI